jgi:hypothetical protein
MIGSLSPRRTAPNQIPTFAAEPDAADHHCIGCDPDGLLILDFGCDSIDS